MPLQFLEMENRYMAGTVSRLHGQRPCQDHQGRTLSLLFAQTRWAQRRLLASDRDRGITQSMVFGDIVLRKIVSLDEPGSFI